MRTNYKKTKAREELESKDKLGTDESFEARIRGALSPYWSLVFMCGTMDLEDPEVRELIREGIPNHEIHKEDLLTLLNASENDRIELYDK